MTYNEKHDRYIDNNFNVYYWDKYKDKLMTCKLHKSSKGYVQLRTKYSATTKLHRLIWETFVGEIPEGMEIDHIDTNKANNNLDNLRCVTPKENSNNKLTLKHKSESHLGLGIPRSEFGWKYKAKFGLTVLDKKRYRKELDYYNKHKKCSWE